LCKKSRFNARTWGVVCSHFVYNARLKIIKNTALLSSKLLLEEFNEQIFNALVEKIEILTPTHFAFELKSGMRVDEVVE